MTTRRRASPTRAHPSSRGENQRGDVLALPAVGSSPLTRGKPQFGHDRRGLGGLIPTHTGKTKSQGGCQGCGWAHPHSRGENIDHKRVSFNASGSSPLTRGKRSQNGRDRVSGGLIPAHAGKTSRQHQRCRDRGAHPRSRGENWLRTALSFRRAGSSPLTRGKPATTTRPSKPLGLIPAHAGKTASRPRRPARSTAHPHSRGENLAAEYTETDWAGSSPPTRGKLIQGARSPRGRGLIPTQARKTVGGALCLVVPGAHPRSRRETPRYRSKEP